MVSAEKINNRYYRAIKIICKTEIQEILITINRVDVCICTIILLYKVSLIAAYVLHLYALTAPIIMQNAFSLFYRLNALQIILCQRFHAFHL